MIAQQHFFQTACSVISSKTSKVSKFRSIFLIIHQTIFSNLVILITVKSTSRQKLPYHILTISPRQILSESLKYRRWKVIIIVCDLRHFGDWVRVRPASLWYEIFCWNLFCHTTLSNLNQHHVIIEFKSEIDWRVIFIH